jgi:hypothetical protein
MNPNYSAMMQTAPEILSALKEVAVVEGPCSIHNGVIHFEDGTSINLVGLIEKADEQDEANAAYIVRACNAHEEMVTCLNRIRGEVTLPPDIFKWVDSLLAASEEGRA